MAAGYVVAADHIFTADHVVAAAHVVACLGPSPFCDSKGKLKLLLLFGFVYVLCNKSASHWKHKLSAVGAPKDLLPPIYIYLLDPPKLSE